jgi:predicted transcriptional regulator of viral defense system
LKSSLADYLELEPLLAAQHGVLLASDLQAFWADRTPQVLATRLTRFVEHGVLHKICRGAYVGRPFDPWVLAARLYPDCAISTVSVLSRHALVGTVPTEQVWCVRPGRAREHVSGNLAVHCWSLDPSLMEFGIEHHGAIRVATPEKAFLDTLHFHLHGRTYPFCVPHDIDVSRLDKNRIEGNLEHYRNPRFQTFVRGVVG